eukprot:5183483-Pyramimonas_sp.AAC.1
MYRQGSGTDLDDRHNVVLWLQSMPLVRELIASCAESLLPLSAFGVVGSVALYLPSCIESNPTGSWHEEVFAAARAVGINRQACQPSSSAAHLDQAMCAGPMPPSPTDLDNMMRADMIAHALMHA